MKKILLVLDSQRREFSSVFRPLYDFLVTLKQGFAYKFKIIPALKKLEQDKSIDLKVITLDLRTEQILRREGLPYISRNDITGNLYDMVTGKKSFEFVRELTKKLGMVDKGSIYKGISLWDMDELGIWRYNFYPAVKFIEFLGKDLERIKPDEVVIFDRNNFYQNILYLMAQKNGFPVKDKTGIYSKLAKGVERAGIKLLGWTNIPKEVRNLGEGNVNIKHSKKKILVSHDMSGPNKIVHWAEKVDKKYNTFYVGIRENGEEFEKYGLKYKRLSDYSNKEIARTVEEKSLELRESFKELKKAKSFKELFTYKGIPLWEASKDFLSFLYTTRYREILTYIELMDNMVKLEKPSIVVTIDDRSRYGKVLVAVAHRNRVKSLIVQHGLAIEHPMYGPTLVTRMALYGKQSRDMFVNAGISASKLLIAGQAEAVPKRDRESIRKKIYGQLKVPLNRKMVTFTSQTLAESVNYLLFDTIYKTMSKFKDVQFVTKLHPEERRTLHEEMIKKYNVKNVIVIKKINLEELLLASDLLLNFYSTVGMEAIRMGVPLVSVNVNKLPESFFAKENDKNIFMAKSAKELEACIGKALKLDKKEEENSIKEAGKYYIVEKGEKACENVASIIDRMVSKHL